MLYIKLEDGNEKQIGGVREEIILAILDHEDDFVILEGRRFKLIVDCAPNDVKLRVAEWALTNSKGFSKASVAEP